MDKIKKILQHQLVSKSFGNLGMRMLGLVLSFVLTKLIIMYYGMAENGLWAIFHSLMMFLLTFSRFGLRTSLVRLVGKAQAEDPSKVNVLISKSLLIPVPIIIFIGFLLFLFRQEFSSYVGIASGAKLLFAAMIPYTFVFIMAAVLHAMNKVRQAIFIIFVLVPFLMGLCIFLDHFYSLGWGSLVCYTICIWVTLIISTIMIIVGGYRPKWGRDITFKEIAKVSLPMMISGSMFQVLDWTDILVLRMYEVSNYTLGEYNLAMKVSNLTILGLFAVNSTVLPQIAKFYAEKDHEKYASMIRQSTKMAFWITAPIVVLISVFALPILQVFDQSVSMMAVYVLLILMAGKFARSLFGCVDSVLNMSGEEKSFQTIILIVAFSNLLLNIILIPILDVYGAAMASALSIVAWNAASAWLAKKRLNVLSLYLPFRPRAKK